MSTAKRIATLAGLIAVGIAVVGISSAAYRAFKE